MLNEKFVLLCIVATLLVTSMGTAFADNVEPVDVVVIFGDNVSFTFHVTDRWHMEGRHDADPTFNFNKEGPAPIVGSRVTEKINNIPNGNLTLKIWSHANTTAGGGKSYSKVMFRVQNNQIIYDGRDSNHHDFWGPQEIPEFPTIALPIIAVLGLAFIFQRRRD